MRAAWSDSTPLLSHRPMRDTLIQTTQAMTNTSSSASLKTRRSLRKPSAPPINSHLWRSQSARSASRRFSRWTLSSSRIEINWAQHSLRSRARKSLNIWSALLETIQLSPPKANSSLSWASCLNRQPWSLRRIYAKYRTSFSQRSTRKRRNLERWS